MKPDGDDQQVDIFDGEGRYVDRIVLRYPAGARNHRFLARWTLLTDDGFFVIPEQEEDGFVSIGKYRIATRTSSRRGQKSGTPGLFPNPN